MKNIAIFGGSFDPPQLGHLMVVSHLLLNHPELDEIIVVPCFLQSGKNLTSFKYRFEMSCLAFSILNRVTVSNIEERLGGESITSRTIQALAAESPSNQFRFIIGADLVDSIKSWEGAEIIERLAPPLVIGRAGIVNSADATPISPLISSTIVRSALYEGRIKDAERYLSAKVLEYIYAVGLYSK